MTISTRIFKVQTPITSNIDQPHVLIYDEAREFHQQIIGKYALQLVDGLGMQPAGDRVYVEGLVTKKGEFIVNKDSLTREPQSW